MIIPVQIENGLSPPTNEPYFFRLLDSDYISDCTVICRDVKWATHKAILCSQNKWFRLALDGPFKVKHTLCPAIV